MGGWRGEEWEAEGEAAAATEPRGGHGDGAESACSEGALTGPAGALERPQATPAFQTTRRVAPPFLLMSGSAKKDLWLSEVNVLWT